MSDDPFTPAELEAGAQAILAAGHCTRPVYFARAVLAAVLPLHAARVRAEVAEEIARDFERAEATARAWAAAIVRAHRTTTGEEST